jgi:hypothetical protein
MQEVALAEESAVLLLMLAFATVADGSNQMFKRCKEQDRVTKGSLQGHDVVQVCSGAVARRCSHMLHAQEGCSHMRCKETSGP